MKQLVLNRKNTLDLQPEILADLTFWLFFMVSVMLKCLYFQFTTELNSRPYFSLSNLTMLISYFGIILTISGIAFFTSKRRMVALFILNIILTFILVADTNFFRYYYNAITIPVFFQFNFTLLSSVDQSVASLFELKDIVFALDLPIMLVAIFFLQKKNVLQVKPVKRLVGVVISMALGFTVFFASYAKADTQLFSVDNNYIIKSLGVFYFHFYNTKEFIDEKISLNSALTPQEKSTIQSFLNSKKSSGANFKDVAKGKNLITIQMEAMQQFVINRTIQGQEITPNLNKLIKESLYFDNFYYQTAGGNTSDAEFLNNESLYPLKEGAVYHLNATNTYHSLPKVLRESGYSSYVFHAYNPEFYNRQEMYKAAGFDTFISQDDYEQDDLVGWEGKSLSDASFFRQSLDKIDTTKPFYGFFITLSSHHPFKYFEDFEFDVGEFEKSYIGNYIKAAHYADSCIGELIQELKKRNLYDNSLLVLYGDHSAVPKVEAEGLMNLLDVSYNELDWLKLQKVPFIIHVPGLSEGQTIHTTGGQIDIMPTLANIMGFDAPYALGKDLLNTTTGYAVLRSGSVITDDYYYIHSVGEVYDAKSNQIIDQNRYDANIRSLQNQLNISDLIIKKDAFSK